MQAICYQKLLLKDSSSLQLLASKGYNLFLFGKTKGGGRRFCFFVLEIIEKLKSIASLENCPHLFFCLKQPVIGIDTTCMRHVTQTKSLSPKHWNKRLVMPICIWTNVSRTLSYHSLLKFHTSPVETPF